MKKRVAYYVSRKNPLIWLAALVMLASAALRIANVCGKGADTKTVWFLVVLPVVGCVFYVLNILCNGSDRFYRICGGRSCSGSPISPSPRFTP